MAQSEKLPRRDFVTKEIFILMVPFLTAYLWTVFYEAGFAMVYSIPMELISLNIIHVVLSNRHTLIASTIAFLWIGLYYNLLPNATSFVFKSLITIFLFVSLALGYFFGRLEATTQRDFFVTNGAPESVVLKIYGNNLVTAPFDRATKTVFKSFRIQKVGDDNNLSMTLEEVGPLTSQRSQK